MHTLLAQRKNPSHARVPSPTDILRGVIAIQRAKASCGAPPKVDPRAAAQSAKLLLGSMAMFLASLAFFLASR